MFDNPDWRIETARELAMQYMRLKDRATQSPEDYAKDFHKVFNTILKTLFTTDQQSKSR